MLSHCRCPPKHATLATFDLITRRAVQGDEDASFHFMFQSTSLREIRNDRIGEGTQSQGIFKGCWIQKQVSKVTSRQCYCASKLDCVQPHFVKGIQSYWIRRDVLKSHRPPRIDQPTTDEGSTREVAAIKSIDRYSKLAIFIVDQMMQ